jgi:hypothetical protein
MSLSEQINRQTNRGSVYFCTLYLLSNELLMGRGQAQPPCSRGPHGSASLLACLHSSWSDQNRKAADPAKFKIILRKSKNLPLFYGFVVS